MNQLYISICTETGRKFLCEAGKDGNLAELFVPPVTARRLAARLEHFSELRQALADLVADITNEQAIHDAKTILKETASLR